MNGLENVQSGEKIMGLKFGYGMFPSETTLTVTSVTPKLLVCKWGVGGEYTTRISKETGKEYGGGCAYNHQTYFPFNHLTVLEVQSKKFEYKKFLTLKDGVETAIKNSGNHAELVAQLAMIVDMEKDS